MTHVASLPAFIAAKRVGCYVHCPRLREVDTGRLLHILLERGARRPRGSTRHRHIIAGALQLFSLFAQRVHRAPTRAGSVMLLGCGGRRACRSIARTHTGAAAGPLTGSSSRCYVPLVQDSSSNMQLLHLGAFSTRALPPLPPGTPVAWGALHCLWGSGRQGSAAPPPKPLPSSWHAYGVG